MLGRLWGRPSHKRKNSVGLRSVVMDAEGDGLLPESSRGERRQQQLHPRLWATLGVLFVIIGIVNVCLAALWRFWLGVALGFGVAKMGTSLCGMTLAARPPPPPSRGCFGWVSNLGRRVLMWGASKMQQIFYMFRWLIYLYGTVVALQVLIHIASPDYRWATFPSECPPDKMLGCSRIAESGSHAARHLQPLHLAVPLEDAQTFVETWVHEQAQAQVLRDSRRGFLHARFLTLFWGFADDFFVSLRCDDAMQTVVEVQGQLRLGRSDLGVNARRNERFMLALARAAQGGRLPEGPCIEPQLQAKGAKQPKGA